MASGLCRVDGLSHKAIRRGEHPQRGVEPSCVEVPQPRGLKALLPRETSIRLANPRRQARLAEGTIALFPNHLPAPVQHGNNGGEMIRVRECFRNCANINDVLLDNPWGTVPFESCWVGC